VIGVALEASGRGIGSGDVGVADDFEVLVIVGGEDRLEETNDGMLAEVGRDVADP
jgi:hypothetical protein